MVEVAASASKQCVMNGDSAPTDGRYGQAARIVNEPPGYHRRHQL